MRLFRNTTTSTSGLIGIILIYVILIAVILIFARQIISDASLETPMTNVVVIPLAVLLPVFMFIAIGIYVRRLLRDRRDSRPGARLRIRFMLVFTLITIVSSIPQGVLAISFIEIAMIRWFSSPVADGLEAGVDLVLEYNAEKAEILRDFGSSPLYSEALFRDVLRAPERLWQRISTTAPFINSMMIYQSQTGIPSYFGDSRGRTSGERFIHDSEGLLPKELYQEYNVLRYLKRIQIGAEELVVVVSSIISKDFDRRAELLAAADDTVNQISLFQPIFRVVVVIFFSIFSVPLLLLSILISFLLSEELIRPIASLESATRRVAEGDFSYRILGRGGSELSPLVNSFNAMVTELERSRNKLVQTEKVAAWQEIAQRMAHEIKNPLTPIKLNAQRLLYRYQTDPEEIHRILEPSVESIILEVDNLNELLEEFRAFARLPPPDITRVGLISLVNEVLEVYSGAHPSIDVDLEALDPDLEITVDRDQMRRVFSNLLKNAFESIPVRGTVRILTDVVRKGESRYCRIQISDTGIGISADVHGRVFNPYFTTKEAGTGLGLPIVERIVFDHNGSIWFETESGVGTTFFIDLPMEDG